MSVDQLWLSVFDQDVCIQTDSAIYSELLKKTYSHFLTKRPDPERQVSFNDFFNHDNAGGPCIIINGQEKHLYNPELLRSEYIHALILNSIYANISSHYLHHAAALSYKDDGMILTADSGYGKTTLTLALVQQGFRFLSDEIAAIGRKDGMVYPYPRGLHIRKETLQMLDLSLPLEKAARWFGKYLVDIDDIFPGMIGSPVKISQIFVLKNDGARLNSSYPHEFRAVIDHTNPVFLRQINDNPDIIHVQESVENGYPCLVVDTVHRMKVVSFFEELCSQHGIVLLDLVKREEQMPGFAPSVECQKIPRSQAALELLRRFLGGHKTALLGAENDQDSTRLLYDLASLIKEADCYQLTVGPLKEMVDVISNIVRSEKKKNYSENKVQVL
jgi:hypothetical protein